MPSWTEVSDDADAIFNFWSNGSDLQWAENIWKLLEDGNLVPDNDWFSFNEARMYLATFAVIYHEFCSLAYDTGQPPTITELADELELDRLALGILATECQSGEDWRDCGDDYELFEAATRVLCVSMRPRIYECLSDAFGHDWTMFHSFYQSHHSSSIMPDKDEIDEFEVTPNTLMAYEFLSGGFIER